MNRTQHHERAEQLLSEAGEEADSIRRRQILAEAQVHATLALSAQPGPDGPGRGRPKTRTGEDLAPSELKPYRADREPAQPHYSPLPSPAEPHLYGGPPFRAPLKPPSDWVVDTPPVLPGQTPTPPYPEPPQPRRRKLLRQVSPVIAEEYRRSG